MELIDVGVNLTHDSFDADREEVIAAAAHAGVNRMIVTGTTVQASRDSAALTPQVGRTSATPPAIERDISVGEQPRIGFQRRDGSGNHRSRQQGDGAGPTV